jgi:hypothetical protein
MGVIILLAIIAEGFGIYLKTPFMGRRSKVELPIGMFVFRLFTFFFLIMIGLGLAFCNSNGEFSNTAFGAGFFIGFVWAFAVWFIIDGRRNVIIPESHNYLETVADVLLLIYSCVSMTFTWEFLMSSSTGKYIQHFEPNAAKIITQMFIFFLFALFYIAANYMHYVERKLIARTWKDKLLILALLIAVYLFAIK